MSRKVTSISILHPEDTLLTHAFCLIVPPKTKGRKRQRETEKPLSGLDVDALLSLEPKRTKISTENAIPEFKQTLSRAENIDAIHDAVQQMAKIIESQITHSLGHSNYDRVIEGLGTMREELVDYEEPAVYNDFVRQLKGKMLREELGGDRRELWWFVRKGKLGLIGKSEVDSSAVEEQEAQEVRFGLLLWNGTSANTAYSFWLPIEELSGGAGYCLAIQT
jgi:ATP-dependent DNA helicase 2 subunit 2